MTTDDRAEHVEVEVDEVEVDEVEVDEVEVDEAEVGVGVDVEVDTDVHPAAQGPGTQARGESTTHGRTPWEQAIGAAAEAKAHGNLDAADPQRAAMERQYAKEAQGEDDLTSP